MIIEVIKDFLDGMKTSFSIRSVVVLYYNDEKFKKIVNNIIWWNIVLHVFPILFFNIFTYLVNIDLNIMRIFIKYILGTTSFFIHLLKYIDLMNCISSKKNKINTRMTLFSTISTSITMTFYISILTIISELVKYLTQENFYYIGIIFNFVFLNVYHSFYCYNNLWQTYGIILENRIVIHELFWPYYLGYGLIITILYMFISIDFILPIYNI